MEKASFGICQMPFIGVQNMAFATNGAAIIGGVVVPASEVLVLRTLVHLGRPAIVPEIANAMKNKHSDAALYSLLGRLRERRLVDRQVVELDVHGTQLRRVVWQPHSEAARFFTNTEIPGDPRTTKRIEGSAGSTGKPVQDAGQEQSFI